MNLHENVKRIKQVMGLITEETVEDLRKILQTKFPNHSWNEKIIERQGDNIIAKGFSKVRNGNYVSTYNPADDFFVVEYVDGSNKGTKIKRYSDENKEDETITKSAAQIKYEEKIKKFPCLYDDYSDSRYANVRETNDGKIIASLARETNDGIQITLFLNLDDSTYYFKGGPFDGEQGKLSCNGKKTKFVVTKSGTKKSVNKRETPDYFNEVTKSEPIVRGMRDQSSEPENGLIYLIQKKLKELNFYTGEPDGQFGPLTHKAVIAFQKTGKDGAGNPLVVDGKVGPSTIESLGLTD
jgi:hypothetical protein